MSLMRMLEQAQNGRLFAAVAKSLDLDEGETRRAMEKLCPVIAENLHQKAAADEDLFQSLLEVISDNGAASPLDEAEALTGAEAMADGNAILDDVFGSRSAAMAALRDADASLPERELAKLAPISATAVVAALAQANAPAAQGLMEPQQAAARSTSGQGFFGALLSALIAGIVAALGRQLRAPARRRRTTGYSRSRTQRRRTTTRRQTAAVEDVFREILGNLGKK